MVRVARTRGVVAVVFSRGNEGRPHISPLTVIPRSDVATGGRLADRALDATVAGVRRRASCNLRRLVRGSSGTWLSVRSVSTTCGVFVCRVSFHSQHCLLLQRSRPPPHSLACDRPTYRTCHRRRRETTIERAAATQIRVTVFWLLVVLLLILVGSIVILTHLIDTSN